MHEKIRFSDYLVKVVQEGRKAFHIFKLKKNYIVITIFLYISYSYLSVYFCSFRGKLIQLPRFLLTGVSGGTRDVQNNRFVSVSFNRDKKVRIKMQC